jgi:sortase (surface protein transpeptidase)
MTTTLSLQPFFLRSSFGSIRSTLLGEAFLVGADPAFLYLKPRQTKANPLSRFSKLINRLLFVPIVAALVVGLLLFVPQVYYLFTPVDTIPVQAIEDSSALGGDFNQGTAGSSTPENNQESSQKEKYQPPKDENLPEGKWLVIPRIGVRTPLLETVNAEDALQKGVWKVPGYAEAGDTSQPMILAAHRFGYDWWKQDDYWKYNSFYFLPDTEPGDIIEIISDQRKWTYEIYGGEEGDIINDYNADMILYTCKFLNSPVRFFRYARLVDPTADTQ